MEHTIVGMVTEHKYIREDISRVETSVANIAAVTGDKIDKLQSVLIKLAIALMIVAVATGTIDHLLPFLGGSQ